MRTKSKKIEKIHIVSLGCSKNLVDSQFLAGQISGNNVQVDMDAEDSDARTVIINTCGFIQDAKQESIDTILQAIRLKEEGKVDHVFVMGCLSERYKKELEHEIQDVDKYFGVNRLEDIIQSLNLNYKKELAGERVLTAPGHYAYLKVSEGCNRSCSFCAIPLIRGAHCSVPLEELKQQAKSLSDKGVKEIILIAQDLSSYGMDLAGRKMLGRLVSKLLSIEQLKWIRLHYAYPSGFPKEVIRLMKNNSRICPYLDIPFQHINNQVLRKMRRGNSQESIMKLIDFFRQEVPGIGLRTSLMVGHPGETPKAFDELLRFVEKVRFERLGVFTYSHEENTHAWNHYQDTISEVEKQRRADLLMEVQRNISLEKNQEKVGKQVRVMIDREEGDLYVGRTDHDSPEVDNEVLVESSEKLHAGQICKVLIKKAEEYDLIGELTSLIED